MGAVCGHCPIRGAGATIVAERHGEIATNPRRNVRISRVNGKDYSIYCDVTYSK